MTEPGRGAGLLARLRGQLLEYRARIGDFSPNARLLLTAASLAGVSAGVAGVLLNLYVVALGYSEGDLARILSIGPLGAAAGALLAGPLVDLWGCRRAMLLGTAVAAGGAFALVLVPTPVTLRAGIGLASCASVIVYVAVSPFLSEQSTPRERPYLFGISAAAYVISTAIGSLLGGFLPASIASVAAGLSRAEVYRAALFAGAAFSGLAVPFVALVREAPSTVRDSAAGGPIAAGPIKEGLNVARWGRAIGDLIQALRGRFLEPRLAQIVGQFIAADGLIRLGGNLVIPLMNVYFVRHLGADEALYGSLKVGERALVVAGMLLAAPLATRWGPVATVAVTQVLSVPLLLTVGFAPTLTVAAGAFLLRGVLMEMTVPTRDNFLMDVVPQTARATANAALLLAGYAIGFVALRVSARLLDGGRFDIAFGAAGTLYVASAALYWLFFRKRPETAPGQRRSLAAMLR